VKQKIPQSVYLQKKKITLVIFIFVPQDYRLLLIYHHLPYLNIVDNSSLKTFLFVVKIYNNK